MKIKTISTRHRRFFSIYDVDDLRGHLVFLLRISHYWLIAFLLIAISKYLVNIKFEQSVKQCEITYNHETTLPSQTCYQTKNL